MRRLRRLQYAGDLPACFLFAERPPGGEWRGHVRRTWTFPLPCAIMAQALHEVGASGFLVDKEENHGH